MICQVPRDGVAELLPPGAPSQAVQELLRLAPPTALLLTTDSDGRVMGEEEVPVALVQRRDLLKASATTWIRLGLPVLCCGCTRRAGQL